jgi:hypothetical protein
MNALFYSIASLVLLTFPFAPEMVRAQDNPGDQDVSFQTFYDQLGDQGTWMQTDDYGYVFQPNVTDPNWAPYTDGHWVSTDEGWNWVSNESWGWATYHYGRWANIEGTGWVWVPGYRWAPAWVSWRYGGGYYGWAPLPPETLAGVDYDSGDQGNAGFHFGNDVDVSFDIGAGCYNFLPVGDMGESNYRGRFANRGDNYGIINNTTNVTNINVNNNSGHGNAANNFRGVTAGGPSLKAVNAHSKQRIQTLQFTQASQPGKSALQGNSLAVFAPRMAPAAGQQAKPARVARSINHPTFNRGDSITKPLDITASVKTPSPTPHAIEAAQKAEANAPATAKIAMGNAPMNMTLSNPFTSIKPVTPEPPEKTSALSGVDPANSSEVHPDAVKPNVPHHDATAPRTDESAKPAETPQPNEIHPQPAPTFHPQTQENGGVNQPANRPPAQPQQETHQQPPVQQQARPQQKTEEHAPQQQPSKNSTTNTSNH